MMYMGLTHQRTVLDEKTLQNVAFVMFLRRRDDVDWRQLRNEAAYYCFVSKQVSGYLVFKERDGRERKQLPLHYKGRCCAHLGHEMRIFRHLLG